MVIIEPAFCPLNFASLAGWILEQEMLDEHPLELERLKAIEAAKTKPTPPSAPR